MKKNETEKTFEGEAGSSEPVKGNMPARGDSGEHHSLELEFVEEDLPQDILTAAPPSLSKEIELDRGMPDGGKTVSGGDELIPAFLLVPAGLLRRTASSTVDFLVTVLIWAFVVSSGAAVLFMDGSFAGLISRPMAVIRNVAPLLAILYLLAGFVYIFLCNFLSGMTIGKKMTGIIVVSSSGRNISAWQSAVRALVLPLSIVTLNLGCLILKGRSLHDWISGTVVITDPL